jgi:hypothetical protein
MKPLCHPQGHIGLASQVELGSLNVLATNPGKNVNGRCRFETRNGHRTHPRGRKWPKRTTCLETGGKYDVTVRLELAI